MRFDSLLESVGGTPLVGLPRLSPSPDVRRCHSKKCASGPWVPAMALGTPVEPDVNTT